MADLRSVKQRFGIVGDSPLINRAVDIACQVAPVDITVLILGESGVGKEFFPKIIHSLSPRKHGKYIAVNCGAIPEGTIDSELFGHEKGSFTDARDTRRGYFETADGGTIFLDEVAELPLATQIRLLRVLETGEFLKVGSSKVQKTNVRVVAATNANFAERIEKGKFREDLYYRLSTVPINVPALRDRPEDIYPLFRRFVSDFSEKNRIPMIELTPEARTLMEKYRWSGNVRQLKNVTEQICIIEKERVITPEILEKYLPDSKTTHMPVLYKGQNKDNETSKIDYSERDLLYKFLFDMKKDITELRALINGIMNKSHISEAEACVLSNQLQKLDHNIVPDLSDIPGIETQPKEIVHVETPNSNDEYVIEDDPGMQHAEIVEESLSIVDAEKSLIRRALKKHKGNRKNAAGELGISERTLYRKIKEYEIE